MGYGIAISVMSLCNLRHELVQVFFGIKFSNFLVKGSQSEPSNFWQVALHTRYNSLNFWEWLTKWSHKFRCTLFGRVSKCFGQLFFAPREVFLLYDVLETKGSCNLLSPPAGYFFGLLVVSHLSCSYYSTVISHLFISMLWFIEHGEGLQILHYEVGQKYEPHFDYFADEFNTKNGGQRIATVLMYLWVIPCPPIYDWYFSIFGGYRPENLFLLNPVVAQFGCWRRGWDSIPCCPRKL